MKDKDGSTVVIQKGIREVPFNFTVPIDALPSYYGKGVNITYHLKATLERDNWIDKNEIKDFNVKNSNHQVRPNEDDVVEGKADFNDRALHEGSGTTGDESYSSIVNKPSNKENRKVVYSRDFRKYNFNYHWYIKNIQTKMVEF